MSVGIKYQKNITKQRFCTIAVQVKITSEGEKMYRVEDYPQIQGSCFLLGRGRGPSRILRGKVGIITFFLRRGNKPWPKSAIDSYYRSLNEAERNLEREAKRYNTQLEFANYQFEYNIPDNANTRDGYKLVKDYIHSPSVEEAQNYYEKSLGCNEVPFILAFYEEGRSFAWSQLGEANIYESNEASAVFYGSRGVHWSTIAHELLHQFGARDYYFPERITAKAKQYFGNSIMGIGDYVVDDLTAYLVGWKNTISAHTYWFLKDTMWYTWDEYIAALNAEWKKKY